MTKQNEKKDVVFVEENGVMKAYQNSESELKPINMENAVKIEKNGEH